MVAAVRQCGQLQVLVWTETASRYSSTDGKTWKCDPHAFCSAADINKMPIKNYCRPTK